MFDTVILLVLARLYRRYRQKSHITTTRLICTKTSGKYFPVQTSHSVNKSLLYNLHFYKYNEPFLRMYHWIQVGPILFGNYSPLNNAFLYNVNIT